MKKEEYMMYKINYDTMTKIDFPTSPFDDIKASIERKLFVEVVEKIEEEIIKKYEEIAVRYGISDLVLLSESHIKQFLTKYLPIYIEEMGLK